VAAYIASYILAASVDDNNLGAGLPIALALICFLIVVMIIYAWQTIGIWRSASNHSAQGKTFWAGAAKFMVVIGLVTTAKTVSGTYFPILSEYFEIAMGDQGMGENHFRLLRNGMELEFSGAIKTGTAKEFERMLDAAPQVRVVHLNSQGGRLTEADLIAADIRKRELVTYVPKHCASACTHVFLAGRERWLGPQGRLGFHQPDIPGLDRQAADSLLDGERRFLKSRRLPNDFITKALATPSDKMWYPTQQELLTANVVSDISNGTEFAASGPLVSSSSEDLKRKLLKVPLLAALERAEPKAFEVLVESLEEGYRRGASQEEITSIMRYTVATSAARQLPYAADADLFKWVDITIGYMSGLKSTDPESCVAIEDGSKGAKLRTNLQAKFPEIIEEELALKQTLFESNAFGSRHIPSSEEIQPYLSKVLTSLSKRSDVQVSVLDKERLSSDDYGSYCATSLAFYQEIRRLPTKEASALLRNLYADAK
jgi:hypothetical protein